MDDLTMVRGLLAAAGLTATEAELAAYVPAYTGQRASLDALYDVPEARYADPALRFRAGARTEDWAR
ncbi:MULTISPECIES: hypothetical protein [Amycolatopsis]|uniref:Uncharacterized protein n=1 Tax=Amycolatopsis thermalba TaxID=944492 RepID=A0ABY4NSW1_9PSEU|nr:MULTISPECIES: hypothetical protein [Amycolatopsis]OXM66649.1 hypothetical protein CF166_25540 [Amycolatopsis sp. KNN50.9b]UQS23150.1 hypothetical protein L1857_10140 [Amycolatopsis thermalba]